MPSSLSIDLRERVVAAVAEGASSQAAAARFAVSVSNVSRWAARVRQEGHVAARARDGDQRSRAIEAQAGLILATHERQPQLVLHELREALAAHGLQTRTSGLSRFLARHGITRKKGLCTRLSRRARM